MPNALIRRCSRNTSASNSNALSRNRQARVPSSCLSCFKSDHRKMEENRALIDDLLRRTKIEVAPGVYFLIGLSHEDWARLLENPELSPRGTAPFMLLRDEHEVTLLLDEDDWRTMRHAAREARVEGGFRLVTLDIELKWSVVGYLARVT